MVRDWAVRFRDEAERARARGEIEKAFPDLTLREADATGEFRLVASLKPEAGVFIFVLNFRIETITL